MLLNSSTLTRTEPSELMTSYGSLFHHLLTAPHDHNCGGHGTGTYLCALVKKTPRNWIQFHLKLANVVRRRLRLRWRDLIKPLLLGCCLLCISPLGCGCFWCMRASCSTYLLHVHSSHKIAKHSWRTTLTGSDSRHQRQWSA